MEEGCEPGISKISVAGKPDRAGWDAGAGWGRGWISVAICGTMAQGSQIIRFFPQIQNAGLYVIFAGLGGTLCGPAQLPPGQN